MRRAGILLAVGCSCLAALSSVGALASTHAVPHWKAWLCFPGAPNDWCSVVLTTTVIPASGRARNEPVSIPANPPVDCFYVYPTVSEEARPNSDLVVEPQERESAISQAAYFSHVCRVYAPMYQQVTAFAGTCPFGGLVCVKQGNGQLAYDDVLAAWKDYLAHDNDGRGVVLIGHSQGAGVLEQLIQQQIEHSPSERRLLVSAVLLGGDVTVKDGSSEGGTFSDIPACTSTSETGCVVAYSTWNRTPPADADLQGVDSASQHVLCVNPAAPGGGSAPITPIFAGINPQGIAPDPSIYVTHNWVAFPHLYTARCVRQGTRAWLLVSRIHDPTDHRPTAQEALGPTLGLHAADVNIALGNLVALVASQARVWLAHR